jgi:hypothetical protein
MAGVPLFNPLVSTRGCKFWVGKMRENLGQIVSPRAFGTSKVPVVTLWGIVGLR